MRVVVLLAFTAVDNNLHLDPFLLLGIDTLKNSNAHANSLLHVQILSTNRFEMFQCWTHCQNSEFRTVFCVTSVVNKSTKLWEIFFRLISYIYLTSDHRHCVTWKNSAMECKLSARPFFRSCWLMSATKHRIQQTKPPMKEVSFTDRTVQFSPNVHPSCSRVSLLIFEDNDVLLEMIKKQKSDHETSLSLQKSSWEVGLVAWSHETRFWYWHQTC